MADRINGFERGAMDIRPARTGPSAPGREVAGDARAGSAGASGTADGVRLSDAAAVLRRAESKLASLPDVDRMRVDALRLKIAEGSYRVDAERVADRLLAMERRL